MRDIFNTYNDVVNSAWYQNIPENPTIKKSNVIKHTRLENMIYRDLLSGNVELEDVCQNGKQLLKSFEHLAQDVFTSFYSLSPKQNDVSDLNAEVKRFNKPIIEKLSVEEDYIAIKSICEGRELPAFDAGVEFTAKIQEHLPELLDAISETKPLETLEKQTEQLQEKIKGLCGKYEDNPNEAFEKKVVQTANRIYKKEQQIVALEQKNVENLIKAAPLFKSAISDSLEAAKQKAEETDLLLHAWGNNESNPQEMKMNEEVINRVRRNPKLLEMSRILGRYIKMIADKRKNGFDYGLGEKYDVSFGNNLNLCLSSELALLATLETQPLFIRKYSSKKLKQYRKRERITRGNGDIIVCIDESSSMTDCILWAKALAFALLDITVKSKRKFTLIRFSTNIETSLFLPEKYIVQDIFNAVEGFLYGGTDFQKPLDEALRVIKEEGFENADIVFITDGECALSDDFTKMFIQEKIAGNINVQGILLNKNDTLTGNSLIPFCEKIYTESDFMFDEIAERIITDKI